MKETEDVTTAAKAVLKAKQVRENLAKESIQDAFKAINKAVQQGEFRCSVGVLPQARDAVGEVLKERGFTAYALFQPDVDGYVTLYVNWHNDSHLPEDQQSEIGLPDNTFKVWTNRKIRKLGKDKQDKRESKSILSKVYTWLKSILG